MSHVARWVMGLSPREIYTVESMFLAIFVAVQVFLDKPWVILVAVIYIAVLFWLLAEIVGDSMTKPSIAHRNGEKEPPTVEGGYFFLGFYAGKIWNYFFFYDGTRWDSTGSNTVTRMDDEWEIQLSDMDGHWWGPVPLPWEGVGQDTMQRWMADIMAANGVGK